MVLIHFWDMVPYGLIWFQNMAMAFIYGFVMVWFCCGFAMVSGRVLLWFWCQNHFDGTIANQHA